MFNEGFASSSGAELTRDDLCDEAIWLGRLLHRLMPRDAETAGLLALMLLHSSRRAARLAADGRPVLLAEQDRSCWDGALIAEGTAVLDEALALHSPGSYQMQAAIAALHAAAGSFEATDWPQIALLYRSLAASTRPRSSRSTGPSRSGWRTGRWPASPCSPPCWTPATLSDYGPLHAAHGFLLEKAGYSERARAAWVRAAGASGNAAVRDELLRRHVDLL